MASWKLKTEQRIHVGRGISLVEVMVVVSIGALLMAILAPSFVTARKSAKRVVCQSRQKSFTSGLITFAAFHRGALPPTVQRYDPQGDRSDLAANMIYHRALDFDLERILTGHVGKSAFICPEPGGLPYDTDRADTGDVYSNYLFAWGAVAGTPEEGYTKIERASPGSVTVADLTWVIYKDRELTYGANHLGAEAKGLTASPFVLADPNAGGGQQYLLSRTRGIQGMNAGYFDGSARAIPRARGAWRGTGPFHRGAYKAARVYLPARP